MMRRPVRSFLLIAFIPALVGAFALCHQVRFLDPLLAWLLAVTLVTFLFYGYDKAIADEEKTRVPERVLLALAFTGGTFGALAGMKIFRHKTVKRSFRIRFWTVVVLQVLLVAGYYLILKKGYFVGGPLI